MLRFLSVRRRFSASLTLALLFMAAGCGDGRPSRVPVSGQVLIDGKPLAYGNIQFVPQGARASQGKLDEHGHFSLWCFDKSDGAVVGNHAVTISAGESIGPTKTLWHAPKKYMEPRASGLKQEITGPNDHVVINISWDGGQPFVEDEDTGATEIYRPATKK